MEAPGSSSAFFFSGLDDRKIVLNISWFLMVQANEFIDIFTSSFLDCGLVHILFYSNNGNKYKFQRWVVEMHESDSVVGMLDCDI